MTDQLFIALFGVTAVALSQSAKESRRKWACVFGLIGQPFWFYAAWEAQQWGIFALCFLYSASWAKGFYTNWIAAQGDKP
jgi:nicotinamide riboside transporter PnuC